MKEERTEIKLQLWSDFQQLLEEQIPTFQKRLEEGLQGILIDLLVEAHQKKKNKK